MSQTMQNSAEFQKFQLLVDNLVDFEKCCKTRICLQRSVPIQPKTSEILPNFLPRWAGRGGRPGRPGGVPGPGRRPPRTSAVHGLAKLANFAFFKKFFANFCKFLAGSFSAVSKRNFARKYAFDSIFKLYKICILLHRCNLKIFAKYRFEKNSNFRTRAFEKPVSSTPTSCWIA